MKDVKSAPEAALTASSLSKQAADYARQLLETFIHRHMPDGTLPGWIAGYVAGPDVRGDLIYLLGYLHELGFEEIAGIPVRPWITRLLAGVDGAGTVTFYSYRIAETVLGFGKFHDNPVLDSLTPAQRAEVAEACDTTGPMVDAKGKFDPTKFARNYVAVLARAERAREQLGLLKSRAVLDQAVQDLKAALASNPLGWFDDSNEDVGRFDQYAFDVVLFTEPLADLIGRELWRDHLKRVVDAQQQLVLRNGATVAWGRSIGLHSVSLTLELSALALQHGVAADPARTLALAQFALRRCADWFDAESGLTTAHVNRTTFGYRRAHRRVQMTLDCIGKIAYSALALREVKPEPVEAGPGLAELFIPRDVLIPFSERGHGVWSYRDKYVGFQLPLVGGSTADYLPWFRAPRFLESPVDTGICCGVPRVLFGGVEYTVIGAPSQVEKSPAGLRVLYDSFCEAIKPDTAMPSDGNREVRYQVLAGGVIQGEETWTFAEVPEALGFQVIEAERPFKLEVECETPFHQHAVEVAGVQEFRSYWGEQKRTHEVAFSPAREIKFTWRIRPILRMYAQAQEHDYVRGLHEPLREQVELVYVPELRGTNPLSPKLREAIRSVDIFHLQWPEHLFPNEQEPGFVEAYLDFIQFVADCPCQVVWTQHNRGPHQKNADLFKPIYAGWARVADAVHHHSAWGMEIMRGDLTFRADAIHKVIPHGHFGEQMESALGKRTRAEVETALGLQPCALRLGVIGRPQKEKQTPLIMEAFAQTRESHPDWQMLVTAILPEDPLPEDPRIVTIPRRGWLQREEIAMHTAACDILVAANVGPHYLTSGQVADAVGLGLPMLVPDWEFFAEILGDAGICYGRTAEDLAKTLRTLTPERIQQARAAAAELKARYSWPNSARQLLALIQEVGAGAM